MTRPVTTLQAALLALALALPAAAQDAIDLAPVRKLAAAMEAASLSEDAAAMMGSMPPTLIEAMAADAGVAPERFRGMIRASIEAVMAAVDVEAFDIDVDAASSGRTGTDRAYVVIPTRGTMLVDGTDRVRVEMTTLAIEDGGEWFMMSIDDDVQIERLHDAFPDMAAVTFPASRVEILP